MALIVRQWTSDDIEKLKRLAESGASVMRCSAALGRSSSSVTKTARTLGLQLAGVRAVKATNREKIAAAEKSMPPGSRRNDGTFA